MSEALTSVTQDIVMQNRRKMSISGVKDVLAFNDNVLELSTVLGNLSVRGSKIKIGSFNTTGGEMEVTGEFYALVYRDDDSKKDSFFRKIFK